MKNLLILIACVSLVAGCKIFSKKKQAEPQSVSFGNGGGFTGLKDEFILKNNGVLARVQPSRKDTTVIKTLDKKQTEAIFKTLLSQELQTISINETGNMTTFVNFYKSNSLSKSYQWTESSMVPKELLSLYGTLMGYTNQN